MSSTRTAFDERLLIGGEWVEAAAGDRFDVTDPATGEVVGSVSNATADDVAAAIDAAAQAFEPWGSLAEIERARTYGKNPRQKTPVTGRPERERFTGTDKA